MTKTPGDTLFLHVEDDSVTVGGFDPSHLEERRSVISVVDLLRVTPEVRRLPTGPLGTLALSGDSSIR